MALLVAENLDKRFGAVVAAAGVAASFDAGERVSLIGSNGAGKTTFVNMITGYLKPDAGRIVLDGRDITALEPRTITRLGVARSFQIPQLYGDLSVLDNMLVANACHDQRLSFRLPAHRADAVERAERLLERFRAPPPSRRRPRGRRSQAARHRDGAQRFAASAAARRADQRRLGRREVSAHGHRDGRARRRRDVRALR